MKLVLTFALSTLMLSAPALAQSRTMTEHEKTSSALDCLIFEGLDNGCRDVFQGAARNASNFSFAPTRDNGLIILPEVSVDYVGSESNLYTRKFLNGNTADVYHVKRNDKDWTIYIVPPGPDGKIRYMRVRPGTPSDEKMYLFATGPG